MDRIQRHTTATLLALLIAAPLGVAAQAVPTSLDGRALNLEESLAVALEQSKAVRDARLQVLVAEKQVTEARGRALPEVQANASYTRNLQSLESLLPAIIFDPTADPNEFIAVRFGADNNWSSSLSLSQALFDYNVFIGLRVASSFRQLQIEALRGTAQQTATATRKSYHGVLLARERMRLTQNSVDRLRQTLEETRSRNRAGLASEYDVLRLEVELGNLEPQLRQAEDAFEAAGRGLSITMGLEAETAVQPLGSLRDINIDDRSASSPESRSLLTVIGEPRAIELGYETLLARAMQERSDLRQARINSTLSDAQAKATLSDLLPRLSASYVYSLSAQENGSPDFFGENSRQQATMMQAGISLQIPLFNGFQKVARLRQQQLTAERVETGLELLTEQATNEVKTFLDALDETRLRAVAQARSVEQARRGFDIASAQYREGVSSRLEVTDAENALRQSEFNYAQAVFDHLNAQADLDLAIGRVPLVDEVTPGTTDDK
ncbi:TolC family protein [Gemmatimonadota bacterium]